MRNGVVLALAAVAVSGGAQAQSPSSSATQFPSKLIRVVNPAAPGGNSDVFFRLLQPKMTEFLGQQLVFDYRAGGGGTIGGEIIAKSPRRWLHHGSGGGEFCNQSVDDQKNALRHGERLYRAGAHRRCAERTGAASRAAGEKRQRTDRAGQGDGPGSCFVRHRGARRWAICRWSCSTPWRAQK